MAASEQARRRAMDAVSHPETAKQRRLFRGRETAAAPAPTPRGSVLADVKRRAMDAVANVETVAQVGVVKLTGGIALYAARIREADREAQLQRQQRSVRQPQRAGQRDRLERD